MQPIWMRVRSAADKGFISPFVMERVQIWKYCFRDGKQHGYNPDYSSSHTNLHQCMRCLDLHWPYYSFIPKKTNKKKGCSLVTSTFKHNITAFPFHSEIKIHTQKIILYSRLDFFLVFFNSNIFNRFLNLCQSNLSSVHSVSRVLSSFNL